MAQRPPSSHLANSGGHAILGSKPRLNECRVHANPSPVCYFIIIFSFEAILGSAQGLLLDLCLEITPGGTRGAILDVKDNIQVSHVHGKHPTCYKISAPSPICYF